MSKVYIVFGISDAYDRSSEVIAVFDNSFDATALRERIMRESSDYYQCYVNIYELNYVPEDDHIGIYHD